MARQKSTSKRSNRLLAAVRACLQGCVAAGEGLLAATSGGADSTALVLALSELAADLRLTVQVGVIDHGLRQESTQEAAAVVAWAQSLGLRAHAVRVKVGRAGGLEAAAREERYRALETLAAKVGARWIVTGHTASDQAETVLLRLGRGAGARGARGVLPRRGNVLRPLLGVTRSEVEAFLQSRGQAPLVEDPSNRDLSRARNRIRHAVLPELRLALGPGTDRALARFAQLARDDEAALEGWARRTHNDRAVLRSLPPAVARRWFRRLCEDQGHRPTAAELDDLQKALGGSRTRQVELARSFVVHIGPREVSMHPREPRWVVEPTPLRPGVTQVAWAGLSLRLTQDQQAIGPMVLKLPLAVAQPLSVRQVRPGDRMEGERGTVRIKRLLIDRKVPRHARPRVAVVTDAMGTVLWVIGHRVAASLHGQPARTLGWFLSATPLAQAPVERTTERAVKKPRSTR